MAENLKDGTEPGKLFVGGLCKETSDESLKAHFSKFGKVAEATVMLDKLTGKSRGFGFVTFEDQTSANKVIEEKEKGQVQVVDGKRVDPKPAKEKDAPKYHRVFVGGVPETTEEDMKAFFSSKYGKVISVEMKRNPNTNKQRGFIFVDFESEDAATRACQEHYVFYLTKKMEIKVAESRDKQGLQQQPVDSTVQPRAAQPMHMHHQQQQQQHLQRQQPPPPQQQQQQQHVYQQSSAHCGFSPFPDYSNIYQTQSTQQQAYYDQYQNYPNYYGASGYSQTEQSYGTTTASQQQVAASAQSQHMPFHNPHSYAASNGRAAPGGYNGAASASDGYSSTSYNYQQDPRSTVTSSTQFSSYDQAVVPPNSYSHMGGHSTAQL